MVLFDDMASCLFSSFLSKHNTKKASLTELTSISIERIEQSEAHLSARISILNRGILSSSLKLEQERLSRLFWKSIEIKIKTDNSEGSGEEKPKKVVGRGEAERIKGRFVN